ncbi:hypothetical protein [Actinokineospora sp. NBRC 105648]|uniref:hypothetical protein n=1 Tax=Actinokineospora sp. NBRC 105648 TaxID=3032206 RepID=UPI0024A4F331|nr:hypothetical protein [Actinokineospora sp. NBRC 105648]GLZ41338.1 hypothetical protein Acsp05_49620 [Actinokineospora sp. NBRC 105648]
MTVQEGTLVREGGDRLDDTTAVVVADNETGGEFHVIDLRDGSVLWDGTGTCTAVRLNGEVHMLVTWGHSAALHSPRDPTPSAHRDSLPSEYFEHASGLAYATSDATITAIRHDDLQTQWATPAPVTASSSP